MPSDSGHTGTHNKDQGGIITGTMPLPTALQMQHEGEMGGPTPAHSIAHTGMQPSNTVKPQGNQFSQLLRLATYATTTTLEHNLALAIDVPP